MAKKKEKKEKVEPEIKNKKVKWIFSKGADRDEARKEIYDHYQHQLEANYKNFVSLPQEICLDDEVSPDDKLKLISKFFDVVFALADVLSDSLDQARQDQLIEKIIKEKGLNL